MSIKGQGHFLNHVFPGFVCFVLYLANILVSFYRTIGPLVRTWLPKIATVSTKLLPGADFQRAFIS